MDEVVEDFIESPQECGLDICTKKQLIRIAEYFKVDIGDSRKTKDYVKGNLKAKLLENGVLMPGKVDTLGESSLSGRGSPVGLSFEQQKELLLLRIKAEQEKEQAMERMRQDLEREKLDVERQRLALIREGKLEGEALRADRPAMVSMKQDDLSDLRLVPRFNEENPETFFSLFERLAEVRGWADSTRMLMLQCVLTGKAQQAFSALSSTDCGKYSVVKTAVLKAYELVPEAYRLRFRGGRRGDKSHLEFMRDLARHFDCWCSAAGVASFENLRE